MNGLLENPVARHASRSGRRHWGWGIALLLLGAAALGAGLHNVWSQLPIYSLLKPHFAVQWLGLTLLAETLFVLPWAAIRGTTLWRRLSRDGHLEEYRRSHLSARAITFGVLNAALQPVLLLLACSAAVALALGLISRAFSATQVLELHLLLGVQAAAFAALGIWLAGKVRYQPLAIPVAVLVLAAAVCAIWGLNPFYRSISDPGSWIYGALLLNPVTAAGNVLDTDVLRFSWIYEHVRAQEFFFVYPPAWQTGGAFLSIGVGLLWLVNRRIASE